MTASNEDFARRAGGIAAEVLGEVAASAERFTTGAGNRVYDVVTVRGTRVVVRFMRSGGELESGVYWSKTLRPLGVPLPRLIAFERGTHDNHPGWMMLERLPGRDLEHAYGSLSAEQKLGVLDEVMRAQSIAHKLPSPTGRFGYTNMPENAPHTRWRDVVTEGLQDDRERIIEVGRVDVVHVDRVEALLPQFEEDLAAVRAVPFLDDTTTRNVIISDDGMLSGIIDVDCICYGDPMKVPALTRMALLNLGCDTLYTDAWVERLGTSERRRRLFDFYTACNCVNFLGEQGQQFNLDAPPPVDPTKVKQLTGILDSLLVRIA